MYDVVTAPMALAVAPSLERPLPSVYVAQTFVAYNQPDIYVGQLHLLSPM